jgi:hypothetical protein
VRAAEEADARFLGLDPIGPLARVRGGVLAEPEDRACRTWGKRGSRWRELDRFGRMVGEVKISGAEYYEYTKCDELEVRRVRGRRGAGIYVAVGSRYVAPDARAWQPSKEALEMLARLSEERQRGIQDLVPSSRVPFAARTFFFDWGSGPDKPRERHAVVGGRSLLVYVWRGETWKLVHEDKPAKMRSQDRGYAAVLVTDMNGDGLPEIVVHNREEGGEWYGDSTLSLQADGTWKSVGGGIFGSTA